MMLLLYYRNDRRARLTEIRGNGTYNIKRSINRVDESHHKR